MVAVVALLVAKETEGKKLPAMFFVRGKFHGR
jgi:hypothetical protein